MVVGLDDFDEVLKVRVADRLVIHHDAGWTTCDPFFDLTVYRKTGHRLLHAFEIAPGEDL